MNSMTLKKTIKENIGWVFILPWLAGFLIFKAYPMLASLYYSFTDFHLFKGVTTTGIDNYIKIFTDANILKAIGVTFRYAFITVPLKLIAALFIAYILNFKLRGVNFFRTAYYIPSILGGSVAISVLWKALFRTDGVINFIITSFNGQAINWLADPKYSLWIISLLRVWQFGSAMVIFLAALKGVPGELYEAGAIDGAGKWRQFFQITIPMITPVIFYNFVTQLAQAFQEFNGPYIITQGGPMRSTTLMSLLVYNNAFQEYKLGLGSAIAWVMFVIILVFTVISFATQKYWVYYGDEER
ncbi:sugar ABC transporter permease [Clostridiales bacterium COT073_COT-073]|nr:sugar ABC transporter permease [Clostridiales bacterium COT073_COT-073]